MNVIYKKVKGLIVSLSFILFISVLVLIFCNYVVYYRQSGITYNSILFIPNKEYGLLLGTSPYYRNGKENEFFKKRINSAIQLYNAKKISKILVSGDGNNNEPQVMREKLLVLGVKSSDIILDYKGYDTFSSIKRAYLVYGFSDFIVISQNFHNKRALFLATALKINAIGFNSKDVYGFSGYRVKFREFFARGKAVFDLIYYEYKNNPTPKV